MRFFAPLLFCATALASLAAGLEPGAAEPPAKPGLEKIGHIIVLYLENRSFDHLYGLFPGADGLANAKDAPPQTDLDGRPLDKLPPVMNVNLRPAVIDNRFPADLANAPFRADAFAGLDQTTGDLVHRFYQQQAQIHGGKMDRFAAISDGGGLTMSYYDGSSLPLWDYARRYVLMDHFFHAAFGGSFLNHMLLVCACAPRYEDAPETIRIKLKEDGALARDGAVTPDGYAVNTIFTSFTPHPSSVTDPTRLLPPIDAPTIGDRLSEKGVDWAWYSGGWSEAVAGRPPSSFQFHHQPFAYFKAYGDGTPGRAAHLKDGVDFIEAINSGTLPPVAFYKPIGVNNEHPGYTSVLAGDRHAADIIQLIERSPIWSDSLIIVTYDENGGYWDHVAPPVVDRWGPGMRVPTILVSPFAKKGLIDHTAYDTTAILKLIETRFGLEPLGERDARAQDLTQALELP
ncbi:acid phosphatase [Methylocella silvestris BL2]|uniref:Acid phosphatase n=1 Tax=Methylocella silvestris (strain DSM 15510 / CIP 108128 / LMG 27833 / NCIMB 13906 / BL2) TaxID=395965 RepID=B8EM99_METSB|nr:alkaline phosphatase family protein [Methylocella silvestris]ACK51488.1 acid phosphatase [Methylocella silvestris BL2]